MTRVHVMALRQRRLEATPIHARFDGASSVRACRGEVHEVTEGSVRAASRVAPIGLTAGLAGR